MIVAFMIEFKEIEHTLKLQKDIDRLGSCAQKFVMRFQPVETEQHDASDQKAYNVLIKSRHLIPFGVQY